MPIPDPLRISRRTAVGGAVVAATIGVAGCTGDATTPARRIPGRTITPAASPDVALAATVLTEERRVLGLVEATARRHPAQSGALASARAVHRAHVALLSDAAPGRDSANANPPTSPSTSPPTSPPTSPASPLAVVPASSASALRAVARQETALSAHERAGAEKARSGAFARVLASMAAAAQQQAVLLGSRAKAGS